MRILGIDLGEKNVGVAMSDELGWTAQPLTTLRREGGPRGETSLVAAIAALAQEHGALEIVVGHPLNMDGSAGPSARAAEEFARSLQATCGGVVRLWDERLSTAGAERTLLEANLSRNKRRKVIDRAAAAYILQGYLDFRARAHERAE